MTTSSSSIGHMCLSLLCWLIVTATWSAVPVVSRPALAHDHRPPSLTIRVDDTEQKGFLYASSWVTDGKDGCVFSSGDGARRFPSGNSVNAGFHRPSIFIDSSRAPKRFGLFAWSAVDPFGNPVGPADRIPVTMREYRRDGQKGYRGTFGLTILGHRYLEARVVWRDVEGCASTESGAWTFHLSAP